ncbi:hypothetical protein SESBI_28008 [Sesbania bispinosa]|nr:hypothetical protein SESBI_28008 [Sesbania bispinosa]
MNKSVFPVPVFKAVSWDNTFEKDPGDFPEAGVLTFQKNAKSIFNKGSSTLCSSLRSILRSFLNRDVSTSFLYEPRFGIVSIKLLLVNISKPWPNQDRVKVKKALREACLVMRLWTLPVSPSSKTSIAYLFAEGSHVKSEIGRDCRSNLKVSSEKLRTKQPRL